MKIADRPAPWLVDLAVGVAVAVPTALDAWWNAPGTRPADALTFLLVAVSVGALLGRRHQPVAVAVVCGAVLASWSLLGHRGELLGLPTMVALYTVAVAGNRRRTVWVGLVAVLGSVLVAVVAGGDWSPVAEMVWPVAALLLGEVVRGRRELHREYAARQARAEADREQEAHRRIQQERLRVAREFHDVVSHTMAAVNVQMGVAVAAFDTRPDAARDALRHARAASREALQELRATVVLLRDSGADRAVTPAPRLSQLDDLVASADGAGVTVVLRRQTDGRELPAVVELTAYRIVQEALSNVIQHARADAAAVSLTCAGDSVLVEVTDNGIGVGEGWWRHGGAVVPGHGLIGMAERAAALGGRVEYGPVPGGGFRVYATLPVAGSGSRPSENEVRPASQDGIPRSGGAARPSESEVQAACQDGTPRSEGSA